MLPLMPPVATPFVAPPRVTLTPAAPADAVATEWVPPADPRDADASREQVISNLAAHIRKRWEEVQVAKQEIEPKMLAALRQRAGEYEPSKLTEIRRYGGSEVFVRLTDTKCAAAAAWIRDVLSLDRPWSLEPTPVPELSPEQAQAIEQQAMAQAQAEIQRLAMLGMGMPPDPNAALREAADQAKAQAQKAMEEEARDRADAMAEVIEDYLAESDFKPAMAEALDWDLVTLGTAILKAPVMRNRKRLTWQQGATGWEPVEVEETYPDVERVSPLDFYPSNDATSVQDASYLIERYALSRASLAACKGLENYNSKEIDLVLEEHRAGSLREWTAADSERAVSALKQPDLTQGEKMDALIFWGEVQGKLLIEWGIKSVERLAEYAVEAWLIGSHVVRVEIKEPHEMERPYFKAVYRSRPGSFWGSGVPELMPDIQQQANAIARALANNAALASGPMLGIDIEQLPPGEDGSKVWPWKVWRFNTGKYGQSGTPPITFFQPEMYANELMQIYQHWVRIADDVTGIPAYVYGDAKVGGAGNTASGLSMLMGAATKTIKMIIANIDTGLIEPLVAALFRYAMLYHPDHSIKGDVKVVAKGSTALLVREQAQVRRNEFLQTTNNPVDVQIMGLGRRAELLRSTAETLSLSPEQIAPTRQEMEQRQAAEQQQQQQMMMQQQQQAALAANPQSAELGPDGAPVSGQDSRLFNPGG